ncbi:DUF4856 domain-containing protein [Bizionia saleffrena]|uniref:DUF4856 domain-containing protein n=1 Tax=Bizionia saleffrena TaxID=291189 RepID=A0A8H2QGG2_9FLAO|nr:DUF4856 domain-containing protein [Bizionia saleffrena]TYB80116.1 DUF4856 domain-containing protein [Bizionia saleffrena]
MKRVVLGVTIVTAALAFTACNSDNDNVLSVSQEPGVVQPTSYEFSRNGESTVSFGGQTTRIAMTTELVSALKINTTTETELNNMFAHVEGNADFSEADLNASGKSIRSKVAASRDYFSANTTGANAIKAEFDTWITEQATIVFPNWSVEATSGTAGFKQEAGGGSIRYVNGKGLELNQAVAKGLIGGLMTDQILNNYLSDAVLDEGANRANNTNKVVESGKMYTTMEHKWDEAFGYLYGAEANPAFPTLDGDSFLNNYLGKVNEDGDFAGIANTVFKAFALGRAAIIANDYDLRDEQITILRENISKVTAVRAVHYLQGGKNALATGDMAKTFHQLSEGFGFIYSLQFTREPNADTPYVFATEVNDFTAQLMEGNGFWEVTPATLNAMSETIATRFGFTVQAAL